MYGCFDSRPLAAGNFEQVYAQLRCQAAADTVCVK